jgi:hypothetical protein
MAEFSPMFERDQIPDILAQFKELGHVGVAGIYDQLTGLGAAHEMANHWKTHQAPGQNLWATRVGDRLSGLPNLALLIADFGDLATDIGSSFEPVGREQSFLRIVEMQNIGHLPRHYDRNLKRLSAIATIRGESALEVDNLVYKLSPGSAVLMNSDLQLEHEAFAIGGARTGFVLGIVDKQTKTKLAA